MFDINYVCKTILQSWYAFVTELTELCVVGGNVCFIFLLTLQSVPGQPKLLLCGSSELVQRR